MLTLYDDGARISRRRFARLGTIALGAPMIPGWGRVANASSGPSLALGKSVIFCFMHGGPSQIETFDPKMTAPDQVRSQTGEIPTAIPGVTFGGTFERLAKLAHKVSIVRSFVTGDGKHDIKPIVSKHSLDANIGSLYARVVGPNHPVSGMPTNAAVYPRSVDPSTMPVITNFGKFGATGDIGSAYAPFVPGGGGQLQKNMELAIPVSALDDRRRLLRRLDRLHARLDNSGAMSAVDGQRTQAFKTILGGVAKAFDLTREDPRTVDRYDTSRLMKVEDIDKKWKNHQRYADNLKALGKLMLLARRLCEAGCRFVTVTTNFVWDMHSDQNNAGVVEGMRYMGAPFDRAISAYIEDVEARGMQDDVLLVCTGEMGRNPKMNKRGGRDHWGRLAPLLLHGGGLRMGQVVGQSNRDAGEPSSHPYLINDLIGTILHTLLDMEQLRVTAGIPDELLRLASQVKPIPELV